MRSTRHLRFQRCRPFTLAGSDSANRYQFLARNGFGKSPNIYSRVIRLPTNILKVRKLSVPSGSRPGWRAGRYYVTSHMLATSNGYPSGCYQQPTSRCLHKFSWGGHRIRPYMRKQLGEPCPSFGDATSPRARLPLGLQTLLARMGEEGFIGNIADSQAKLRVLLPSLRPDEPTAQCRHWSAVEDLPWAESPLMQVKTYICHVFGGGRDALGKTVKRSVQSR